LALAVRVRFPPGLRYNEVSTMLQDKEGAILLPLLRRVDILKRKRYIYKKVKYGKTI
jgi:hypothetical protein